MDRLQKQLKNLDMMTSDTSRKRGSPVKLRPLKGTALSPDLSPKAGTVHISKLTSKAKPGYRRAPFEGGLSRSRAGGERMKFPGAGVERGVNISPLELGHYGNFLELGREHEGPEDNTFISTNRSAAVGGMDRGFANNGGGRHWKRVLPNPYMPDPMSTGESQALAKLLSHAGDGFTQKLVGPVELQAGGTKFQRRIADDDISSQGSYAGSKSDSVTSQYSNGNFEDHEGSPHAIVGVQRLHGLRRDMTNLPRKQRRALSTFSRPIRLPGNRSVQAWVASYGDDRSTFASKTRWAQSKLAEAQQLVEIGALPHSVLVAASMQMLVELEDKLTFMVPEASLAITHLFRALYMISDGVHQSFQGSSFDIGPEERSGADEAALSILSRRNPARDRVWAANVDVGVDDAQRERLMLFLRCTTYHEECVHAETKLEYELSLRPGMEERLAARASERRMERQIFTKISKRWGRGVMWRVMDAWHSILDEERKKQRMGQVLVMINDVKPKHIFDAWKRFTSAERWLRVKNSGQDKKEKMAKLKQALRKCEIQTKELKKHEASLKEKVVRLRETLKRQLDILHDPARQPPTLQKNLQMVTNLMKSNQECFCDQLRRNVKDLHRRGIDTTRLASLYKWKGVRHIEQGTMDTDILQSRVLDPKSGEPRWDHLEEESDVENDIEDTIHSWRPGIFKSTEKTPAFTPFRTRSGRRLRRWFNNTLRRAWDALGDAVPEALLPLEIMVKPSGTGIVKMLKTIVSFLQVNQFHSGTVLDPRPSMNPRIVSQEKGRAWLTSRDFQGSARELAQSVVKNAHKLKARPGRYLSTKDLTGDDEPPSEAEVERERKRMERLKARELEEGIIVHVMSRYMGQRVHVVNTAEPKLFAFLAELFTFYFQGRNDPIEEDHTNALLKHVIERFEGVVVSSLKLAKKGPVSFSKKELQEKAEEMRVMHHLGVTGCKSLHEEWIACLRDREEYVAFLENLMRTTWQSLCTTVLARKVRVEEDIDDGTFTTVHQIQVANEFKRIGIEDDIIQKAQCEKMSKFLKTRIRDMKRIFSFYAASGDGSATSMDHSEFWRVVKDCKLQKDRKALPSVRVDLIFQQCNQDFSKEGKVRKILKFCESTLFRLYVIGIVAIIIGTFNNRRRGAFTNRVCRGSCKASILSFQ